jgi:hypothetical protein
LPLREQWLSFLDHGGGRWAIQIQPGTRVRRFKRSKTGGQERYRGLWRCLFGFRFGAQIFLLYLYFVLRFGARAHLTGLSLGFGFAGFDKGKSRHVGLPCFRA